MSHLWIGHRLTLDDLPRLALGIALFAAVYFTLVGATLVVQRGLRGRAARRPAAGAHPAGPVASAATELQAFRQPLSR